MAILLAFASAHIYFIGGGRRRGCVDSDMNACERVGWSVGDKFPCLPLAHGVDVLAYVLFFPHGHSVGTEVLLDRRTMARRRLLSYRAIAIYGSPSGIKYAIGSRRTGRDGKKRNPTGSL